MLILKTPMANLVKKKPSSWERNKIKLARDSGIAYISAKGKQVKERKIGVGGDNKCKKNRRALFTEDQRQQIFDNFWSLKNHVKQWGFIASYVRACPVKRRSIVIEEGTEPKRNFSYIYELPIEGFDKVVCQRFFHGTLGISQQWIRRAIKNSNTDVLKALETLYQL